MTRDKLEQELEFFMIDLLEKGKLAGEVETNGWRGMAITGYPEKYILNFLDKLGVLKDVNNRDAYSITRKAR